MATAKPAERPGSHGFKETVGKRFCREREDVDSRVVPLKPVGDTLEQVSFPESNTAMNEQRIE